MKNIIEITFTTKQLNEPPVITTLQKEVDFPLSKGLEIIGSKVIPSGTINTVVYNYEKETLIGNISSIRYLTSDEIIVNLLKQGWVKVNV